MGSDVAVPASGKAPLTCWRCLADTSAQVFCPSCGAVQPFPDGTSYFSAMGIAQGPVVDRANLDQRYYELSRRLHPDRFQTGAPEAQAISAANSALVNRAYRTLKDPVERGRYWLELRGTAGEQRQTTVPANLAAIVFEVQEQLEQVRAANPPRRAALAADVVATRGRIADAERAALQQLDQNFAAWTAAAEEPALATKLARILADIAYIRTLLRDIDKTLDV